MKTQLSVCVIISLLLLGCAATETPAPLPVFPTVSPSLQAAPATVVLMTTLETATMPMIEQTATTQPSETVQPTPTSGLVMEIVGGVPPTSVSQPLVCQHPQNWVLYRVQRNDTLSSLAQQTGVDWQQIQAANCLAGTTILAGQTLYLPFVPQPIPPPAVTEGAPPTATVEILPPPGPGDPTVTMFPTSGPPTTTFKILITDFEANEPVTVRIFYVPTLAIVFEKSAVVNAAGDLLDYFPSPAGAAIGDYTVDVSGTSSAATGAFTITSQ